MEILKYKVIKGKKRYAEYCSIIEELVMGSDKSKATKDEIELPTLLVEKWDEEHNSLHDVEPVTFLKALMNEKKLFSTELTRISLGK